MSATPQVVDGIDTRIEILEKPNPLTPGWDWIVRFANIPNSAARRFPNEDIARQYAQGATKLLTDDDWQQIADLVAAQPAATGKKAGNA